MSRNHRLMSSDDANRFGFEWRDDDAAAAPVQVTRMADLGAGRRVVGIRTPRAGIKVYITRSGLVRVFRDGRELK